MYRSHTHFSAPEYQTVPLRCIQMIKHTINYAIMYEDMRLFRFCLLLLSQCRQEYNEILLLSIALTFGNRVKMNIRHTYRFLFRHIYRVNVIDNSGIKRCSEV